MGIAGSKDDRGVRVLQALPPGFLDERGKELRNELDLCLEQNGWYFTIGGLVLTVPICFRYKTERPFYVAAILSPMADMYLSTLRCTKENEAFAQHYRYLHKKYHTPVWKQQQQQQEGGEGPPAEPPQQQEGQAGAWQQQRQQEQQPAGDGLQAEHLNAHQQQHLQQQQQQQEEGSSQPQHSRWWWKQG